MSEIIHLQSWNDFKNLLTRLGNPSYYYIEKDNYYDIYIHCNNLIWNISLLKNSQEAEDFEQNYKPFANLNKTIAIEIPSAKFINDRLLVDTGLYGYNDYLVWNAPNITIPQNTEYTILNINGSGIMEEIHINFNSSNFYVRLYKDNVLIFNITLNDIYSVYGLTNNYSSIFSIVQKDFHYKDSGIIFNSSFKISVITSDNNKNLVSYLIKYKIKP